MQNIQQGDMLKISGLPYPMIVVSNDFFNQEGKIIACPIVRNAAEGPLHIRLKELFCRGLRALRAAEIYRSCNQTFFQAARNALFRHYRYFRRHHGHFRLSMLITRRASGSTIPRQYIVGGVLSFSAPVWRSMRASSEIPAYPCGRSHAGHVLVIADHHGDRCFLVLPFGGLRESADAQNGKNRQYQTNQFLHVTISFQCRDAQISAR